MTERSLLFAQMFLCTPRGCSVSHCLEDGVSCPFLRALCPSAIFFLHSSGTGSSPGYFVCFVEGSKRKQLIQTGIQGSGIWVGSLWLFKGEERNPFAHLGSVCVLLFVLVPHNGRMSPLDVKDGDIRRHGYELVWVWMGGLKKPFDHHSEGWRTWRSYLFFFLPPIADQSWGKKGRCSRKGQLAAFHKYPNCAIRALNIYQRVSAHWVLWYI